MHRNDDRVSDRDRLERDAQGRLRGDQRQGDGEVPRGKPQKDFDKMKKNIFVFAVVAFCILMFIGLGGRVDLNNTFRTWDMTNEQGIASVFNAVQELDDINKRAGEDRGLLDENRLYHDSYIEEVVDKEYLVYVYTGDDRLDKEFTEWVRDNDDKVKIYRIEHELIETNEEVKSYIEKQEPMVLVYNEVERGKKRLEGVIKDARLLPETLTYIGDIIQQKQEEKK